MTPKPGRYGALPVWNTLHLVLGVLILAGLHEGVSIAQARHYRGFCTSIEGTKG